RAELRGAELRNLEIIFRAEPKSPGGLHFGSRLVMDQNRTLYVSLGERGGMENAQNLNHHGGSVVKINPDGSVPSDNPFTSRNGGLPEIFSYGHRNPQGMALHPETGELWLHEHGPRGGDEVNIIRKGGNYGWPLVTYGMNYNGTVISESTSAPGIEEPVVYWVPSIAPSGMAFYQGDLYVGALAGRQLRRLVLNGNRVVSQDVLLKDEVGRIRDVRTGPDGALYILTDDRRGVLYRLAP
ncbi:MAG: PQQ-dependent sugar dehydrogenase, partial [Spirochaetales bacterium]|nr:PQQ-dependent sugar dehydrogenase [Spirochaetales bacterium]